MLHVAGWVTDAVVPRICHVGQLMLRPYQTFFAVTVFQGAARESVC